MTTTALHDVATDLTTAVGAERAAAESLAYRLTAVRLLLDEGEPPLLPDALAELELAAEELTAAGRRRETARGALADRSPSTRGRALAELVAELPRPWSVTLEEHRLALHEIVERIGRAAATDGARGRAALEGVRRRLGASEPRRHLEAVPHPRELQLVEDLDLAGVVTELRVREVTYEGLIAVMASVPPTDLVAFVAPPTCQY